MKITQKTKMFIIAVAFLACSSETEVGTGSSLDSVSPQPTAVQLATALRNADYGPEVGSMQELRRKFITHTLNSMIGLEGETFVASGQRNCPGGGTFPWEYTGDASSFHFEATAQNCKIVMSWDNEHSYSEVLNGTVKMSVTDSATITHTVALTISGDLGLAAECNLSIHDQSGNVTENATYEGTCIFRDSEGTTIEANASELTNLMFTGFGG